jgi:hypothetical protein
VPEIVKRRLDVAVEVGADRHVIVGLRDVDNPVDVRADDLDALLERLGRRGRTVARPVLAHDHPQHAATPAHLADHVVA